jgi:O-antigen ligase
MSAAQRLRTPSVPPSEAPVATHSGYPIFLWMAVFANSIFFIWPCLDRYLAPRFLFLSVALLISLVALRKELLQRGHWRLHGFDLLLLGWYGLNVASAFHAMSWSEGIFFAQKTLLLFVTYWLLRQALSANHYPNTQQHLARITIGLTWVLSAVIAGQLLLAISEKGLDNEYLYAYASGLNGNKGLASDFLFFLLVLNVYFNREIKSRAVYFTNIILLLTLIVLLQTRTVYLALFVSALLYSVGRYFTEPAFRPEFLRRWVPAGALAIGALAFLALRGDGSLSERLNPLTYLESASANERRFVWYKTDLLNADHYWWGVGNGSWKFWLPSKTLQGAYRLQEKGIVFTRAHNDYLEIRAEMGMIGAVYFVGLFVLAAAALVWALRRHREKSAQIWAIGAGLLGYCFIQYFDFPRERIEMQVMLALFFAASATYGAGFWDTKPGITVSASFRTPLLGLMAVGLLYSAVIGWYRVTGETHNVKMALAYQKQDHKTVLKEAKAAKNSFLEYNDVGIPFEWYEGTALYKLNKMNEAVQLYEKAVALNPWSFQVLNNYATVLASVKQYEAAIPIFEKAVEINPKYDEGKFNLAYSHTQLGNYTAAMDWLNKVDTIPNPKTSDEVEKNKSILSNLANFRTTIQQKINDTNK